MKVSTLAIVAAAAAVVSAAACGDSNPNRPSVSFAAPSSTSPAAGVTVRSTDQPLVLSIVNAVRAGKETATYTFEVARDPGFSSIAFRRADIAEDPSGTTSVSIDTLAAGTTYYWHARAKLDGVEGAFADARSFRVQVPVTIDPPAIVSPAANSDTFGDRPVFTVRNAVTTGPVGSLVYDFQVSSNSGFTSIVAEGRVSQQSGQTSFSSSGSLPEGTLFWRARAVDVTNDITGPYQSGVQFRRLQGIDLTRVVYQQGPDISGWAQTSVITSAYVADNQLCIFHTQLGNWPATDFFEVTGPVLEGNQWVFANINGTWYAGAADWYRPGQACKGIDQHVAQDSFSQNPLAGWVPRSGEVFGVMATTPARLWPAMKTLDQRTNVVLITWP